MPSGEWALDDVAKCWVPSESFRQTNDDDIVSYENRGYSCTTERYCVKFEDPQTDVDRLKLNAVAGGVAGTFFFEGVVGAACGIGRIKLNWAIMCVCVSQVLFVS